MKQFLFTGPDIDRPDTRASLPPVNTMWAAVPMLEIPGDPEAVPTFGAQPGGGSFGGRMHHPPESGACRIDWLLPPVGLLGGIAFDLSPKIATITDIVIKDVNSMVACWWDTMPEDAHIITFHPIPNRSSSARYTLEATFWGEPAGRFGVRAGQLVVGP